MRDLISTCVGCLSWAVKGLGNLVETNLTHSKIHHQTVGRKACIDCTFFKLYCTGWRYHQYERLWRQKRPSDGLIQSRSIYRWHLRTVHMYIKHHYQSIPPKPKSELPLNELSFNDVTKKKKHGRQNFRWHPEINLSWDPSRKTRDPIRQFTSDHLAGFVVPSFDLSKWWTFIHDFYSKQSPTLWSRRAHRKMRFHHHITHLTKSRIFSDWKSASWLISLMIFRRVTIHRYLLIFPKENRGFQVFF